MPAGRDAIDRSGRQPRIRCTTMGNTSFVRERNDGSSWTLNECVASFACPCCGYLTLQEEPPGTYAICPVCGWEDDDVQARNPEYDVGANAISVNEARANFERFRAKDRAHIKLARPPQPCGYPGVS